MEQTKPNTPEAIQEEKPKLSRKAITTIAVALIVVIVAGLAVYFVRLNGSNIFNNQFDTRSVQGNQDYRMKINNNWASFTFAVIYKFGGYKEKNVKAVDTSRMGH